MRCIASMKGKMIMKKVMWIFVLLAFLAVPAMATETEKKSYNIDMEKIKTGELQIYFEDYAVEGKGKKKRVIGIMLINAPPEIVWHSLKDWEAMGDYVPGLDYYKVIHVISKFDNGETQESLIEGKLKIPLISLFYTMYVKYLPSDLRVEWHLVNEKEIEDYNKKNIKVKDNTFGIKSVEGYSHLQPIENNTKTIYFYSPILESSIPVPQFIEQYLTKKILTGYLNTARKYAESANKTKSEEKVSQNQ